MFTHVLRSGGRKAGASRDGWPQRSVNRLFRVWGSARGERGKVSGASFFLWLAAHERAHEEAQVRRSLGHSAHEVRVPVRSVRDIDADSVPLAR